MPSIPQADSKQKQSEAIDELKKAVAAAESSLLQKAGNEGLLKGHEGEYLKMKTEIQKVIEVRMTRRQQQAARNIFGTRNGRTLSPDFRAPSGEQENTRLNEKLEEMEQVGWRRGSVSCARGRLHIPPAPHSCGHGQILRCAHNRRRRCGN